MSNILESLYDKIAPIYNWTIGPSLEGARKKAIEFAQIQKGEKVLEVGVGTGLTFRHLPRGIEFVGVDLSQKMLAKALKKERKLGLNYELIKMDASKLLFPDESFDLVISAHFLSATSNPIPALLEMKRVLKNNGRILLVNNFQKAEFFAHLMEPLAHKFGFSMKLNLEELCSKSGLRVGDRIRASKVMPIDAVLLVP
jgi:phosphatidylethanolamine/phosphatidyl-N-methylethanolamine N-methyltransferase